MKKIVLISGLLLGFSGLLNSQVLITLLFGDKLNSPNMEFGLHAGANITTLSGIAGAKYTSNLNLGFFFGIRLSDKWSLHPELLVKSTSGAKNLPTYALGDPNVPELDPILLEADLERKLGYFQLPLLVRYELKYGLAIEGGIQPSLRAKARDVFTDELITKDDFQYTNKRNDDFNRLDFGLTGGLAWRLRKDGKGMVIIARYTQGLVNTLKDNSGSPQKNSGFSIGALVPIGVKKAEATRAEKEAAAAEEKQ